MTFLVTIAIRVYFLLVSGIRSSATSFWTKYLKSVSLLCGMFFIIQQVLYDSYITIWKKRECLLSIPLAKRETSGWLGSLSCPVIITTLKSAFLAPQIPLHRQQFLYLPCQKIRAEFPSTLNGHSFNCTQCFLHFWSINSYLDLGVSCNESWIISLTSFGRCVVLIPFLRNEETICGASDKKRVILLGLWGVLKCSVPWETTLGTLPIPELLKETRPLLVTTISPWVLMLPPWWV